MFVINCRAATRAYFEPLLRTSLTLNATRRIETQPSAKITINPSFSTVIDQPMDIVVTNLSPRQNVTLRARMVEKTVFESLAHYKANDEGEVLVSRQPALAGSYTGIEPMGLFWSMKPPNSEDDLLRKKDVTTPLKVTLDVYDGAYQSTNGNRVETRESLVSVTLERCYMAAGVTRHTLEENGLHGTLFLPPGDGPFPGVVDTYGSAGGLREDRAALLASNGFASLALAYCGYKDLPPQLGDLDLSYFGKAVQWLTQHPSVLSHGVGLLGISHGGTISLAIANQLGDRIRAAISLSGAHFFVGNSLKCDTFTLHGHPFITSQTTGKEISDYQRMASLLSTKTNAKPESIIPAEHITCPVLLVYGDADGLCGCPNKFFSAWQVTTKHHFVQSCTCLELGI